MKKIVFALAFIFAVVNATAQDIKLLDGKWAFSGSRTTVFTVQNDSLFISLVDDNDLKNFETFYSGKPITDRTIMSAVRTSVFNGKMLIAGDVKRGTKSYPMVLLFDQQDSLHIQYIGDVYYDDKKTPYTNTNCDTNVPYCTNRLYSRNDIKKISQLKSLDKITKPEVLDLFKKHEQVCKTKCNKCYEGFPGADMNGILIEMGYNPINKVPWNQSYKYSVSAFDFIMDKYSADPEIEQAYKAYAEPFFFGPSGAGTNKK